MGSLHQRVDCAPAGRHGYDAGVHVAALTLVFEVDAPGEARVTLLRAEGELGLWPRAWRGRHAFDPEQAEAELRGLARTLRRVVRRGDAREVEGLTAHGRLLFDLLLPPAVKAALRAAPGGLLTVVQSGAPAPPWPLLHDGARFLGRHWALGEIGADEHRAWSDEAPAARSGRLLVVADPAGDLPAARYEGEALVRDLARAGDAVACDLRLGALRRADFLRIFKSFRLVHYAGHADPEDASGAAGWRLADGRLDAEALRALGGGAAPSLVFANACSSVADTSQTMAEALMAVGVRHYLGTTVDLPDLPGADFAGRFYAALCAGAPVGEALRAARVAAADAGEMVWAAYRLFGDPAAAYFRSRPGERWATGVRRGVVLGVRRPVAAAEPEALADIAERRRARLREIVGDAGGRLLPGRSAVDRAVFGLPVSYENDAVRAARAALALHAEAPDAVVVLEGGPLVSTAADVVGEAAVQVEAACWRLEPGVYVLPGAARRLEGQARLLLPVEGARRLVALEAPNGRAARLVGRHAELSRLEDAGRAVLDERRPVAATILAPAGMGKSCLVDALGGRLRARFRVLRGAGIPYDEVRPFAAAAGVLRALLALDEATPADAARAALEALVDRLDAHPEPSPATVLSIDALLAGETRGPRLRDRLPALAAVLGLQQAARAEGLAEPGRVPAAFRQLIEAVARERPLLLVFEDLHWLPDAGLALVDELVAGLAGVPVLLVATARPELLERAPRWFDASRHLRIDLGPLPDADAEAVLRQFLPDGGEDLDALRRRAEGNPLFLRELALARADGDEGAPPPTVEAVMQARVDRQSPFDQQVLRAAAVLGRTFWREGAERLLDAPAPRVEDALRGLERRGFVVRQVQSDLPGLSQWRFTHALLQEVLYHGLGQRARAAWHGRAALWLTDEVEGAREDRWARIAAHRAAAGDPARAAEAWLKAAERAAEAFAPAEARKALDAALAQDDAAGGALPAAARAEAEERLAELAQNAGDLAEAARRLDDAVARTSRADLAARAERLRRRAEIDEARGELSAARARLAEGLALVSRLPDPASRQVAVAIRRDEAWLLHRDGAYDTAVETLTRLVAEVPADERRLAGTLHNAIGVVSYRRGDDDLAERSYQRALAAFEGTGNLRSLAAAYNNLGMLAMRRADYRAAERWYQQALRIQVETGDRNGLSRAYNNLGSLYGLMGDYARAAQYIEEAIRIRKRSGHAGLAICYANLGECYLKQHRREAARGYLEEAIALCADGRGPGYLLPDAWRMLAELHLEEGAVAAAVEAAQAALDLARDSGDRPRAGVAARVLGEALAQAGREAEAGERLAEAVADLEALDQPEELGRAYAAQARHLARTDAAAAAALQARADALLAAVAAR